MSVTFYGHAVLRFDGPAGAALCDPWFSRSGAFFRSWFQFPENSTFEVEAFRGLRDVLISHNHQDHYDPPVLRRALAREPELLIHIARFATPWFERLIARELPEFAGRLRVHEPHVEFDLAFGKAFFVPEESPGQIDSAIIWRDQDRVVVNMNDARLNTGQLEKIAAQVGGRIDLLTLQASGASEYPVNYLYPEADMRERKLEKRKLKFEACERIVELLDPRRILFFAGPPVFLDPTLAAHNDLSQASVFPDQLDILKHYAATNPSIAERSYFVLPGETLDESRLWSAVDLESERLRPFTSKVDYIEAYRGRRGDVLDFELGRLPSDEKLLDHFERMATLSVEASEKIAGALAFVIFGEDGERAFTVDFVSRSVEAGIAEDALYVLRAPASAMIEVVAGRATWDDMFLSLRMSFDEKSPRFVAHFKTLLKYLDPEIMTKLAHYEAELARPAEDDMMTVECEGRCFRIQRHCPHAGVDLQRHGRVNDDATITCMAHRFRFDLATGRCLTAEGYRLETRD